MGLNAALAVAGRSLEVFTAGIEVSGQNIANANTPGYIREQLELRPNSPYRKGRLVFGTGVQAIGISQQIDLYLETRLHGANSDAAASAARESVFKQLEAELRELGDEDLSTRLNNFLSSLNEIVNTPEDPALRQYAVQQGSQLASDVRSLHDRVNELRRRQDTHIDSLVQEANELIDTINELNPKILDLEIAGLLESEAGALRSQRYEALNRLSEILPIQFQEKADGTVDVFSGSDYLILNGTVQHLETFVSNEQGVPVDLVQLSKTKAVLPNSTGELAGVIEGRDSILGGFVGQLDAYASTLIDSFNRAHAAGEGLVGFTQVTSLSQVDAPNLPLNAAGLPFSPTHGSFDVKVVNKLTGEVTTATIAVDLDGIGTDTTLNDLQTALDALGDINASITTDNRLQLTADPNFEIRFSGDSSGTLAGLGINTFFTGSDAGTIGVNAAVLNDHRLFATSSGGGPSDGSNAIELAQFLDRQQDGLNGLSLDTHYNTMVASVAHSSAAESAVASGFAGYKDSLLYQREQYSGVSLDEETIRMMQFQRSYQAAARIISTVDDLFNTLLSI